MAEETSTRIDHRTDRRRETFLACALANAACRQGLHARYYRASQLVGEVGLARPDGTRPKLLGKLSHADLLVIDDWGMATLTATEARDRLDLVDDRCLSRSALIASSCRSTAGTA